MAVSRKPFSTFFTYLDRNETQMTTLHATLDPFVGTLRTTIMALCTSPQ